MTDFKKMSQLLKDAGSVAIAAHIRPDGDCIGSSVALRLALLGMGKKTVDIFADDILPENLVYLPGFDIIKDKDFISNNSFGNYDLLVILDSSSEDRIARCTELRDHAKKVLVVDHHLKTYIEGDVVVSNSGRESVGTILYEYFCEQKIEITRDIATALYTSIATDTGCFVQDNTTSFAHKAAAALIDTGIDLETINYHNFRLYSRSTIPGLAYALNNIKFFLDGKAAAIVLPLKVVEKYQLSGELHQFKKYASEASGVLIGIIISEKKKNEFNVSLRSRGNTNVAAIAEKFGGGGHNNASGFTICGKQKKVLAEILEQVEQCLSKS